MTPQEQRIALCEWMGWHSIVNANTIAVNGIWVGYPPKEAIIGLRRQSLPDTNSLDVLHEMEKKLAENQWITYIRHLCFNWEYWVREGGYHAYKTITHATATQRREALLKTLGLWKD